MEDTRLGITEIFHSLQGESRSVGWPTVFIRLTGCPLRCTYCDTSYAFSGGEWLSLEQILARVQAYRVQHVCVTGGEPLAQRDCLELLSQLCAAGYEVSLETSGALDVSAVDPRVSIVMDLKTPGSGELTKNLYENIAALSANDQLKMVICDQDDYAWAKNIMAEYDLSSRCEVLLSPCHGKLKATDLAEWILADQLPVRLQLQLHKILWGEAQGR
ncbi:MAG: 7-carboxy-7-deazaguanine synthase QueE [Thiohalomonadaceae bacterium]